MTKPVGPIEKESFVTLYVVAVGRTLRDSPILGEMFASMVKHLVKDHGMEIPDATDKVGEIYVEALRKTAKSLEETKGVLRTVGEMIENPPEVKIAALEHPEES